MNKIIQSIFKNKKPNSEKLLKYGFNKVGDAFVYQTDIFQQFLLKIKITGGEVQTLVIENDTQEPYTLFLTNEVQGSFVGAVRQQYQDILTDIANKCFDKNVFKTQMAKKVIDYVSQNYDDELEFLWEKFDENAIWRREDNKKWYGAILTVKKCKLGLSTDEKVEVLDLRAKPEKLQMLIDNIHIFSGYHMNKKHWISVLLDECTNEKEVFDLIDQSYIIAGQK